MALTEWKTWGGLIDKDGAWPKEYTWSESGILGGVEIPKYAPGEGVWGYPSRVEKFQEKVDRKRNARKLLWALNAIAEKRYWQWRLLICLENAKAVKGGDVLMTLIQCLKERAQWGG
jgi:hypothetical protein